MRNYVEVDGIAANDAAERDDAVISAPAPPSRIEPNCNRARDFERARHGEAIELGPRLFQDFRGARQQRVGNVFIKPPFDNENPRAFVASFLMLASPRSSHGCAPACLSTVSP